MSGRRARVVIVGRPNVGKSTLYNRIIQRRDAIVDQRAGITRDRQESLAFWQERGFIIVDTGGYEIESEDELARHIQEQLNYAIDQADVIIFLVDGKDGLTPIDSHIASLLRKTSKPVILTVNKIDAPRHQDRIYDFCQLGLSDPIAISAEHNINLSELLNRILALLPTEDSGEKEPDASLIKVAIIGRPNVGKSSLINRILGEERLIVHDIPGTTRDAIDSLVEIRGERYIFTDTAGLKRKARVKDKIDRISMLMSLKRIKRADIAVLLIDATEGVCEQDARIAKYVDEAGRGIILAVNKWDLIRGPKNSETLFIQHIRERMPYLSYAPVCFLSALTGQGVASLFPLIKRVFGEYNRKIPTAQLNALFQDIIERQPPPLYRQRPVKIYYITQLAVCPPSFICFVNNPDGITPAYERFLINQLREAFGFQGTPLRLLFRPRRSSRKSSLKLASR